MGCTVFPELTFEEFYYPLQEKAGKLRFCLSGSIELTARCNLGCKHCYINLPTNDRAARAAELSTEEVCRILDEVADAGCIWLLMTGGEPLLRPDALDIYVHAQRLGIYVDFFTNGTLVTPQIANVFAEWPPRAIEITLYGMTEATYEAVTGVPGSYKRCMRGIELLHERGLPLKLKAVVLSLNKHELESMRAFAESLGQQKFRVDYSINPRLDGSADPCAHRLEPREIAELQMADPQYHSEFYGVAEEALDERAGPLENLYVCGAGETSFHIDPYGALNLCLIARRHSYDLRTGSFAEGFGTFLPKARTQAPPPDFPCSRCEVQSICQQCPGWSELTYGVPGKPVEFLCELTHRRVAAAGVSPENPVLDVRKLDQEQRTPIGS
jgi:radical SAM protein with 4Fe4S-binding SPASM domain